jgi:hypothetical protein
MRMGDVIVILLGILVFSLAIAALLGVHFSLSTGAFYWGGG